MVRIGNREQIFTTSLLLADDEEATVRVTIGQWHVDLSLVFVAERNGQSPGTVSWSGEGNVVRFHAVGWKNVGGASTTEPAGFGDVNGRRMYFQLAQHRIGSMNLAHLFISLGDAQ